MELVLDSNEYISAFGLVRKEACTNLLKHILERAPAHRVHICRTIANEVRRNLFPAEYREFILFANSLMIIDEDFFVPFSLGEKYVEKGLKPADAFIAAYTEWTGAEILVSENRHFLSRHRDLPFRVLTAEKCLALIKHL